MYMLVSTEEMPAKPSRRIELQDPGHQMHVHFSHFSSGDFIA